MKAEFLIDTVIIIDHLNGIQKATNWLAKNLNDGSVISFITRAEVLSGASKVDLRKINLLLNRFECLPVTAEISDIASDLRRKYKWKLPDAFQAALAQNYRLKLVTRNTKDFPPYLNFVKIPYLL